ncbi:MAG: transglutaminase domain-containing protein [Myxococcales bacterium]|nr:transglutaminase domain-containing protein [Myxococcales bacterium]
MRLSSILATSRRRGRWGAVLAAAVVLVGLGVAVEGRAVAQQAEPMLHEYFEEQAGEALEISRTDASGELPASVETPSGTITPPDIRTTPDPRRVYHEQNGSAATGFRPDRDTRRPHVEQYDDPFTPTLTPFKRMFAYDAVRDDYTLVVQKESLSPVPEGGAAEPGDDRFFGDISVALRGEQPVRIPSVGPGARLLNLVASPDVKVSLWRDGADNWFAKGDTTQRVRLVTEIAIGRDAFASEYPDIGWAELPRVPAQPSAHGRAYAKVAEAIGIGRHQRPREVVSKMVAYFRSFAPSDDSPQGEGDIYLDLALSKKGVCRHRAFAFLVTALNVGIPARLIHNEAHAWVEVRDDRIWRRIDLGGAALDLDQDPHLERPPHVPPPDQFPWPTGRDSGSDLAHRDRAESLEKAMEAAGQNGGNDPAGAGSSSQVDPLGAPDPNAPNPAESMPATELTLGEVDVDIFRGLPVRIAGKAKSAGQPCPHIRVDVVLVIDDANERRLGSLSTDERGAFAGAVVIPPDVPIGDHDLVVATPGAAQCGPGQAR